MRSVSLEQGGDDVSVALLGCLMKRSVILVGAHVNVGTVLQQEPYHREIAKVRGHVDRPVAGLGLALDVRPVLHQDRRHPDEVLLRAQVQRRETVLRRPKTAMGNA